MFVQWGTDTPGVINERRIWDFRDRNQPAACIDDLRDPACADSILQRSHETLRSWKLIIDNAWTSKE
jgi:hypothetical protein